MQKRSLVALLLLSLFGSGMLAGPHPCEASHGERESGQPSCHEAAESPQSPGVRADASPSEDERSCCDTLCRHACHRTAVAAATPIAFAIAPVSQAVAEVPGSGLPLFAHPIDHIPLG
jgi:hypothetical protein